MFKNFKMELVKIILFSSFSFGLLCNAKRFSYHIVDRSGEANIVNSNCMCLPTVANAPLLPNMIDGADLGLERLVTYFYINPQTFKITAYTPNVEKQQLFPDLSFDEGDDMQLLQSNENINNIVILNSNKVERPIVNQSPLNHITINENQNTKEVFINEPSTLQDTNTLIEPHQENDIESQEVMNSIISPQNHAEIHFIPHPTNILSDVKPLNENINTNEVMHTMISPEHNAEIHFIPHPTNLVTDVNTLVNPLKGNIIKANDIVNTMITSENNPGIHLVPHATNILKDVSSIVKPLKENVIKNEAINGMLSPESSAEIHIIPHANMETIDANVETLNEDEILNQLLQTYHTGVITVQNGNESPTPINDGWQMNSVNNVYNWQDFILNEKDVLDVQNIQTPGYLKFEQWFQQQMDSSTNKKIQNGFKLPNDNILKSLVYKYLFKNGIIFMDNGILKNNQGDTFNLSNLKLQPVLIGLSLGYNYPTADVQNQVLRPRYDAMALYMTHPQKMLGIIPISTNYRPDSKGYTTINFNKVYPSLVTSSVKKTHCVNGKCHTSTIEKDFPLRSARPQMQKATPEDADMNGRSAQPTRNKEVLMKIYRSDGNPLGLLNIKQTERSTRKKSKRIPVVNDLLTNLYNMILSNEVHKKAGKKTPKYEVRTIEDEGPDFRIVGGSAATGSGTPVSSRGRSAF